MMNQTTPPVFEAKVIEGHGMSASQSSSRWGRSWLALVEKTTEIASFSASARAGEQHRVRSSVLALSHEGIPDWLEDRRPPPSPL